MTVLLYLAPRLPAQSEGKKVRIIVRDEQSGRGVRGDVYLLKEARKIPVDETDADGALELQYVCGFGDRFYAEPKDGSFFPSSQRACQDKKEVILLVLKRETAAGVLIKRESKVVNIFFVDGSRASYLASWSARVKQEERPQYSREGALVASKIVATSQFDLALTRLDSSGGLSDQAWASRHGTTDGVSLSRLVPKAASVAAARQADLAEEAVAELNKEAVQTVEGLAAEEDDLQTERIRGLLLSPQRRSTISQIFIDRQGSREIR